MPPAPAEIDPRSNEGAMAPTRSLAEDARIALNVVACIVTAPALVARGCIERAKQNRFITDLGEAITSGFVDGLVARGVRATIDDDNTPHNDHRMLSELDESLGWPRPRVKAITKAAGYGVAELVDSGLTVGLNGFRKARNWLGDHR